MEERKMRKKRILLLVLVLCLAVSMSPMSAFAGMDEEKEIVALIGNTEYTDFQEAISDVKDGETITLVDDVYGGGFDTTGKEGTKFTIDLNENKIINSTGWWITLYISGGSSITIKNGSILNTSANEPEEADDGLNTSTALFVDGRATLRNVNILTNGVGAAAIEVGSKGVLKMTGCKAESLDGDYGDERQAEALFVDEGGYVKATKCEFYALNAERAIDVSSKIVLDRCKAKAASYSVIAFAGSKLQISNGTYKGSVYIGKGASGTINGGYFKDEEVALLVFGSAVIKDGKFYGSDEAVYSGGGKITVHKGYFNASSGKAWTSKLHPTRLDKSFKIAKNSKVVQKNWKSGKRGTIKVIIK